MNTIFSILWFQNDNFDLPDILIINNKDNNDSLRAKSNHIIMQENKPSFLFQKYINQFNRQEGKDVTIHYNIFRGLIYHSALDSTNATSINKSYVFWHKLMSVENIINDLKSSLQIIGHSISNKELNFIKGYIRRIYVSISIFSLITLVIFINLIKFII